MKKTEHLLAAIRSMPLAQFLARYNLTLAAPARKFLNQAGIDIATASVEKLLHTSTVAATGRAWRSLGILRNTLAGLGFARDKYRFLLYPI